MKMTESDPTRYWGDGVNQEHQSCFNVLWASQYSPSKMGQSIDW